MELIMKYLGCGAIYKYSANAFELKVVKFSDIKKRIIPFFDHPGSKTLRLSRFL
jgi:hypothetical protein